MHRFNADAHHASAIYSLFIQTLQNIHTTDKIVGGTNDMLKTFNIVANFNSDIRQKQGNNVVNSSAFIL
jgi:hypothetical protein